MQWPKVKSTIIEIQNTTQKMS